MQSRETSADLWHQKPYYSLDAWCKNTYGRKLYKAALDIGCTCPNRDGTLDTRGCIFCSAGGSGDFAASRQLSVTDQLNQAKALLSSKWTPEPGKPSLIAYFQAYTNTYGDPDRLLSCYEEALSSPEVAGISIATRPIVFPISFWRDLTASGYGILTGLSGSSLVCSPFMTTLQQGSAGGIRPPYFMMLQQSSMPKGFPLLSI